MWHFRESWLAGRKATWHPGLEGSGYVLPCKQWSPGVGRCHGRMTARGITGRWRTLQTVSGDVLQRGGQQISRYTPRPCSGWQGLAAHGTRSCEASGKQSQRQSAFCGAQGRNVSGDCLRVSSRVACSKCSGPGLGNWGEIRRGQLVCKGRRGDSNLNKVGGDKEGRRAKLCGI